MDFPFKNTRIVLRSVLTFTSFLLFVAGADFWSGLNRDMLHFSGSSDYSKNLIPAMVILEVFATIVSVGQAVMYCLGRCFTKSTRKLLMVETVLDLFFFLFHLGAIASLWSLIRGCDQGCSTIGVITGTMVFNILIWSALTIVDMLSWVQLCRGPRSEDLEVRSSLRYNNM